MKRGTPYKKLFPHIFFISSFYENAMTFMALVGFVSFNCPCCYHKCGMKPISMILRADRNLFESHYGDMETRGGIN